MNCQLVHTQNATIIMYKVYLYFDIHILVPNPSVAITAPNTQIVGQSLTLQCEVTTVRDITSSVDIVWSNGGTVLRRMNGVSLTTMGSSLVYTHSYTFSLLSEANDGNVINCAVVINASPSVMATDSITLDVTSKCDMKVLTNLVNRN